MSGGNDYIDTTACWVGQSGNSYFDPRYYDPNDALTYPIVDVMRNTDGEFGLYWWFRKQGNGFYIELGRYT